MDNAGTQATSGGFVAHGFVAKYVAEESTSLAIKDLVKIYGD